ncbi:FimD/PapC N-terminal domain-containing protein [Yersinia nurmii]|uniref:FimD/PapC N-terminal domain-containing protein n=1 Tax=Yersinia nurmii TaxID=685706 RepID=A0AAW7K667_9GAMM|nr:FimD/PapC N-terminal domain-containing protein [Yersinia nurmii]MDN0086934.1 FimD/PapC N-terminal domain-containing protein [Yersinia nurmii]CNE30529.1 outer membrane usher protein [Yersinia nurmii]
MAQDHFRLSALELSDAEQAVIDLSAFSNSGGQLPVEYQVVIFLNGNEKETRRVRFIQAVDKVLLPQLIVDDLRRFGVKISSTPTLSDLPSTHILDDLKEYIPQVSAVFNFYSQRLGISIPQAALGAQVRDTVSSHLWQQGQTTFLVN